MESCLPGQAGYLNSAGAGGSLDFYLDLMRGVGEGMFGIGWDTLSLVAASCFTLTAAVYFHVVQNPPDWRDFL